MCIFDFKTKASQHQNVIPIIFEFVSHYILLTFFKSSLNIYIDNKLLKNKNFIRWKQIPISLAHHSGTAEQKTMKINSTLKSIFCSLIAFHQSHEWCNIKKIPHEIISWAIVEEVSLNLSTDPSTSALWLMTDRDQKEFIITSTPFFPLI